MRSMIVEGWRGINQSYAIVNHFQLLELKRHDLSLFHRDVPLQDSRWNLQQTGHGLRDDVYAEIANIGPPPDDLDADVLYRICWPLRFDETRSKRLFVFGTLEFQTPPEMPAHDLERGLAMSSLTIVTPSQWSAEGFRRVGFDDSRIAVIPHGIDPSLFKPPSQEWRQQFRQALNFREDEFVLLNVGAMTQNKGIEYLVIAYALVRQIHGNVRLVLKDQRTLYNHCAKDIVDKLKLERPQLIDDAVAASILYISQNVTVEQLAGLYGAVDCYVSPYLAEGFNMPPLEAAACGTPIVVTRGGATDDYVDASFALQVDSVLQTNGTRYWVMPSIDSIVEQVCALIENRAPHIDRDRAVEHIHRRFSWHAVVAKLVARMFE